MTDESVPTGDGSQPNETPNDTPSIDTSDPAFQAAVEAAAKEKADFYERAAQEYEDARLELLEARKSMESQPKQQQPQPGNQASFEQFYQNIERQLAEEGGLDPQQARHITRGVMGANYELVKLMREREQAMQADFDQKLSQATEGFSSYRESRAFHDLAADNPTIGGVPYSKIPREVIAEAQKIRDREFDGLSPRAAIELALGRKGGQRYVQSIEEEKKRSDAATGLPASGGGLTTDRVRRALSGKNIRSMSLAEMEAAYQGALGQE